MKIGQLRHYVNIENKVSSEPDGHGQVTISWEATSENVPASIETTGGAETEVARQKIATAAVSVTMRFHSDVSTKSRIVWGSRLFNVNSLNNVDQRNQWLILTCTEDIKGATDGR